MEELDREARHRLRSNLVTMEIAAGLAFNRLLADEPIHENTPAARNRIAQALAALIPLYTFDEERTRFDRLLYDDLRTGYFIDGGRSFQRRDGSTIERLAVDSTELSGAIARLSELRSLLDELLR